MFLTTSNLCLGTFTLANVLNITLVCHVPCRSDTVILQFYPTYPSDPLEEEKITDSSLYISDGSNICVDHFLYCM